MSLRLENISVAFGKKEILQNVGLEIPAGNFFTLLGLSGSGKTTLLKCICGLQQHEGLIYVADKNVTKEKPADRQVGMVFQDYALFPHLNVSENIAFGLLRKGLSKKEIGAKVNHILGITGLTEEAKQKPDTLSGGQKQRVALARTMILEPKVLLLDEPLTGLDAALRETMKNFIWDVRENLGCTVVQVTHIHEDAAELSDSIGIIDGGTLIRTGSKSEVYGNPKTLAEAIILGLPNVFTTIDNTRTGTQILSSDWANLLPNGKIAMALRAEKFQFTPSNDCLEINGKVLNQYDLNGTNNLNVKLDNGLRIKASLNESAQGSLYYPKSEIIYLA